MCSDDFKLDRRSLLYAARNTFLLLYLVSVSVCMQNANFGKLTLQVFTHSLLSSLYILLSNTNTKHTYTRGRKLANTLSMFSIVFVAILQILRTTISKLNGLKVFFFQLYFTMFLIICRLQFQSQQTNEIVLQPSVKTNNFKKFDRFYFLRCLQYVFLENLSPVSIM